MLIWELGFLVCPVLDPDLGSGDGDEGLGADGARIHDFYAYSDAQGNTVFDWRLRGALDYSGTTNDRPMRWLYESTAGLTLK